MRLLIPVDTAELKTSVLPAISSRRALNFAEKAPRNGCMSSVKTLYGARSLESGTSGIWASSSGIPCCFPCAVFPVSPLPSSAVSGLTKVSKNLRLISINGSHSLGTSLCIAIASTGHAGSHAAQSIHSSGLM